MKLTLGLFAASLTLATSAFASEIYVREARGNLTSRQKTDVTSMVKSAVKGMSEHHLVSSAASADFTLQPSVITRGDELVLRVEKQRNGEILSMSEETINSVNSSKDRATAVTQTALADSNYGSRYASDDDSDRGTSSAMTSSADDVESSTMPAATNQDAATSQRGVIDVSGNTSNAAAAPATRTENAPAGADASVGELTAASPRMQSPDRLGQVQLGVGPSFGINMKDDSLMYDLLAAYAINFNENFVGKVFGDFNFATGSSVTHFVNLGLAGEYYPSRELLTFGKPYLGADLGYAFARDALNRSGDSLAGGIGAGFKFQAAALNWDVQAHYTILLSQIADESPSVFGVRVALGF